MINRTATPHCQWLGRVCDMHFRIRAAGLTRALSGGRDDSTGSPVVLLASVGDIVRNGTDDSVSTSPNGIVDGGARFIVASGSSYDYTYSGFPFFALAVGGLKADA